MALYSFEALDSGHDESDSDDSESATVHPLEANLSPHLRHGLAVRAFYALVASALDELAPDPKAPNLLGTGLAELAILIDVLSRSSISVFTSALFDLILAEAQHCTSTKTRDGGVVVSVAGVSCAPRGFSTTPFPLLTFLSFTQERGSILN